MRPTEDLPVQAGYAAWAPLYDGDGNPLTAIEGPAVRAWFGPVAGRRAIDIGCGTGRHTGALVEAGAAWIAALDLTPEMLTIARARPELRGRPVDWVRHALPDPLPFPDATFDLAVLGLVAEHVAALVPALAEVARVLAPGGRCVLSALHPERTAEGQSARFIDPATGLRRSITTYHRTTADYLDAARAAGLVFEAERVLTVPAELAERLPRALPYVGRNLGWVARWSRPWV
jgi:SAM-dependent methyltransferase